MVIIYKAGNSPAHLNRLSHLENGREALESHPSLNRLEDLNQTKSTLTSENSKPASNHGFYVLVEESESQEVSDQNKLREGALLETEKEAKSRQLKVQMAKDCFVNEIKITIENINHLCEKYKGKSANDLIAEAKILAGVAPSISNKEEKNKSINKSLDLVYLASLPIKKAELLRNKHALIGSIERLESLFKHIIQKHGLSTELMEDDELLTLTAYYLTKSKHNPNHIINHIPDRLIKEDSEKFKSRVKLLTKHILVDLNGITSAREIELYLRKHNYLEDFKNTGLTNIWNLFSFRDLIKLTFPKSIKGNNPSIRDWFLARNLKEREALTCASDGAAWVLEHGTNVYDRNTNTFDIEKMRRVNWRQVFDNYGLDIEIIPQIKDSLELIKLGAKRLGVDNLIGHEREDQFHEWDAERRNMWKEEYKNGRRLIDYVTEFLVEVRLRKNYPEIFEDNGKGKIISEELKKIKLSDEYESIAPGGLQNSKITVMEAFKRRYSHCFANADTQPGTNETPALRKDTHIINHSIINNPSEDITQVSGEGLIKDSDQALKQPSKKELTEIEGESHDENFEDLIDTHGEIDSVYQYLKEIGNIPLLSRDKEIELAKIISNGNPNYDKAKEKLLNEIEEKARKGLSPNTEKKILGTMDNAKKELTEANLRLVVSIAKKYRNRGLSFLDLIQEGSSGLMRAAEKFEPELGYKFGTYATWWIRQGITRALANYSRTVRIPVHMIEAIGKLRKATKKLKDELLAKGINRKPTEEELAQELETTIKHVKEIITANKQYKSIESQTSDNDKAFGNILEDEHAPNAYEEAINNSLSEDIAKVLKSLVPKEREVIVLRMGLDGNGIRTLDEIAELWKCSKENVRQFEARAMKKLRSPERMEKLEGYLN